MLKDPTADTSHALEQRAVSICEPLRKEDAALLSELVASGEITAGRITITLALEPLAALLGVAPTDVAADVLTIQAPFQLRRRGVETRIVAGDRQRRPDPVLTQRLAEAHRWVEQLRAGRSMSDLAAGSGPTAAYIRTRIQLAFLSPRIQAAIMEGTQPPELSLARILRVGVSLEWAEQERVFGIDGSVNTGLIAAG